MVDEFYGAQIIQPLVNASRALWAFVDVNIIDKATFVVGDIVRGVGSTARTLQTGNLQQYALYIALGAVAVLFYVLK
jgi:NADH-quinone oxidoreductase subunit L